MCLTETTDLLLSPCTTWLTSCTLLIADRKSRGMVHTYLIAIAQLIVNEHPITIASVIAYGVKYSSFQSFIVLQENESLFP